HLAGIAVGSKCSIAPDEAIEAVTLPTTDLGERQDRRLAPHQNLEHYAGLALRNWEAAIREWLDVGCREIAVGQERVLPFVVGIEQQHPESPSGTVALTTSRSRHNGSADGD